MKRDYIEITLTILTVILALFAIFLALWKLFGNSPTSEQLTFGFLTVMATWLFSLSYKFGNMDGKFSQYEKNIKDSFGRVKQDLDRIEIKVDRILQK